MRKLFMANGLRRSGNHAISTWILSSILEEEVVLDHKDKVKKWQGILHYRNNCRFDASTFMSKFENVYLGLESKHKISLDDLKNYNKSFDVLFYVPILRNPINHVPSIYRHKNPAKVLIDGKYIPCWNKFFDMLKWEGTHTNVKDKPIEVVPILYDKWFISRDYRDQIAEKLGIPQDDMGVKCVSGHGYGSSFDSSSYNGKADSMKVLDRWRQFDWSPKTLKIIRELRSKIEEVFGPVPKELLS